MRNILYLLFAVAVFFTACEKTDITKFKDEDATLTTPSGISNLTAEPRVGGALLKWTVPTDSNYTYLEVAYEKEGKDVITNVSKHTDSVLVTGLLNKLDYTFRVTPVNRNSTGEMKGSTVTSPSVKPIIRPDEVTYYENQLTKLNVTANMLETYTQETSEGPKTNLVDGNPSTYWHSAWSSGVAPLPHWIRINFAEPQELGLIKYYFRNPSSVAGRPTQFALEISDDGTTWTRVFTSGDLPSDAPASEKTVSFQKNYTAKHFRIMILKAGGTTYAHLGEMSFYSMYSEVVDKEKEAEDRYTDPYYNF